MTLLTRTGLRINRYCSMADFPFFKMAAVRHLGFVLRVLGPPTKRKQDRNAFMRVGGSFETKHLCIKLAML